MEKIKVLVNGCNGHMGKIVCQLIEKSNDMVVLCGIDISSSGSTSFPIFNNFDAIKTWDIVPDVIIDFSQPECTMNLLYNFACEYGIPMVIATTGFTNQQLEQIESCSKKTIVFLASNMSYSVSVLAEVLRELAPKLLGYDIEIVETHHNRKKDAPSGTAKTLAEAINSSLGNEMCIIYGREGKRKSNEIGISSLRGGNIVGTHTINFFGPFDTISITHTAHSREMFAEGALKAARHILKHADKGCLYGLFTMKDMM